MVEIRIKDLPSGTPVASKKLPMDLTTTESATIKDIVYAGRPAASQAEAEAGTDADKAMTPLTSRQAIDARALLQSQSGLVGLDILASTTQAEAIAAVGVDTSNFASSAQGAKADAVFSPYVNRSGQVGLVGDGVTPEGSKFLDFATLLTEDNLNDFGRSGRMAPGVYVSETKIYLELGGQNSLGFLSEYRNGAKIVFTNPNDCGISVVYPRQTGVARAQCPSLDLRGVSLLSLFLRSEITGGGPISGKAFEIEFNSSAGAPASPTPGLVIDGLTIDSRTVEALDPSYGSWAVGASIKGINFIDMYNPVFSSLHTGAIGLDLSTDPDLISVQHNINSPRVSGTDATGIRATSNDEPLQGIVVNAPQFIIGGGSSRGIKLIGTPDAPNNLGDHFEIRGGHLGVDGIAVDAYGWENVIVDSYILGAQVGVNVERCKDVSVSGILGASPSNATARAVVMTDCAQDWNRASNIDAIFQSYTVSPVWLKGTTSRVFTRGQLASQNAGTSSPQNLVQDDSSGSSRNSFIGISRDKLSAKTPPTTSSGEEVLTAAWHIKDSMSLNSQAVFNTAGANTITSDSVGKLCVILPGVSSLALPNPAPERLGKFIAIRNATGGSLTPTATGGTVDGGAIPSGKDRFYMALGSNWTALNFG